ncbi:AraC family transcriptional regulator [Nocardiopsis sp. CT-R113]|uniref:AraC family transcriptional regulator n=1 Tax=Nocardiopsis codii TaxID=3065942 RepID=A0ABU7K5K1_9ACTN|nr:AraC family transcriptional regulator [Nocardiopsis sp. CT-R113]MEE2037526.1 AraC family transcriptional regulator [Nocardiopsis sp. CT-R113]
MIESIFHTRDLPPEERFGYWRDCIGRTHAPVALSSDRTDGFLAYQHMMELSDVLVWPTVFQPVIFDRTPRLIRFSDPESYHLSLVTSGRLEVESVGRSSDVGANEINVIDTSTPFRIRAGAGFPRQVGIGLEVPRKRLSIPEGSVEPLVGSKLSAASGYGVLLRQFLAHLAEDSASYRPSDGDHLSSIVCDLVSGLFARSLEVDDRLPPESRRRTLLMSVRNFIRSRLGDRSLTPRTVAAAHHISTAYLHRVFREQGTTVGAWIREQRLANAHRDLADPNLDSVPVHRIGEKWGFSSAPVFSRAYRDVYGVSPRDTRGERGTPASRPS